MDNKYDPVDDVKFLSTSLLSIAIVLGVDADSDGEIIFDDLINETRKMFKYKPDPHVLESEKLSSAFDVIKKHHLYLTRAARRNWNSLQIARFAMDHE